MESRISEIATSVNEREDLLTFTNALAANLGDELKRQAEENKLRRLNDLPEFDATAGKLLSLMIS